MALVFCLSFAGCDNTCFIFVSNPSGGTIAIGSTTCPPNKANGTVHLRLTSSVMPAAGDWPASIQHIFVTFQGIEANRSAMAIDDSPDWQELAPQLATVPIQLDLLAHNSNSCESNVLSDVAVPADTYRQIRLRLSSGLAETNEPIPQENGCGNVGFNCIVKADGGTRALVLDSQMLRVSIPPDQIAGGSFRILPGTAANLTIEFSPHHWCFPQMEMCDSSPYSPSSQSRAVNPRVLTLRKQNPTHHQDYLVHRLFGIPDQSAVLSCEFREYAKNCENT
jgi:hypothetical protein